MKAEQIQERIALLEQQKQSVFADFNALHGAIKDCEYWLAVLKKQEEVELEKKLQEQGDAA